ncbi:MAG: DUF177 domain-containing protein [Proteobacteria bacterium]|nr:DUF177 domain-containing protein [Pseudomonadota bacterium]
MNADANMVVSIHQLPLSRDIELGNAFVRTTIAELPTRAILECPHDDPDAGRAKARVELYSDDESNVFLRGQLSGWFAVGCSRCVEPVKVPFDETLAATFRPAGQIPGADLSSDPAEPVPAEGDLGWELTDDDLDLYSYEAKSVDLEPLLREQLILAVPFAPLCREDCQGLCPQCGANRNCESCACEPPIDPRLAALQDIDL